MLNTAQEMSYLSLTPCSESVECMIEFPLSIIKQIYYAGKVMMKLAHCYERHTSLYEKIMEFDCHHHPILATYYSPLGKEADNLAR